jgi:predicted nucleotidyltransferase
MSERLQKAIAELVRLHQSNPENIALIICGSVARKEAREDSDVDLYLVVTEEAMERVSQTKSYFYGSWDPNKFFGIEIDGKIIGMRFLREAVLRANDPTRVSFQDAYTAFSHSPEVDELIKEIYRYPEWEQENRIKAFYAYVKHYRYIGESAFRQGNDFLFRQCVLELVFFAGRLALAHNHRLFPSHKALFKALAKCPDLPDQFIEQSQHLLKNISLEEMLHYYELVIGFFQEYDYPDIERIGLILENEWTWYTGQLTISEW